MNNEVILTAKAHRERKFYKPYKSFRPNFKKRPLAGKFYSIHECGAELEMNRVYREMLAKMYSRSPKSNYPMPVTESQRYGWFLDPLLDNVKDFRLDFRNATDPEIKLACEMLRMAKHMRK